MKFKIVLLLALIGLSSLLSAQEAGAGFSLQEAQAYALKNNKTLQNAMADVDLAEAQLKEAKGAGLPKVDGSLDYMTNFGYEFLFSLGGDGGEPPVIDYTKLDAGDFEVLKILESMSSSSSPSIKMSDQASANIQVSQLIFSGQYWVGIEMAKLGKVIREKGVSVTSLEIKEQVINSYYLILITQNLLRVIEENELNMKEMYTHSNNLYQAGLAEKTDVDQIRINMSQLENSKRAMQRNLQLNYNMFRMLLGLEAGTEIVLSESLDGLLANLEGKMIPTGDLIVDDNLNFQMMKVQEQIGEKKLDMQKWAYAPTLVGFYSYKEKILASAFDLSPNHAAGLTMSIPIFSGGAKNAQLTQAKIELDKAERNISLLREQLALQNDQLVFNLTNAFENFQTQKASVGVAKDVYYSIKNKFQQGLISTMELTQANSNYLQAESNYVSSLMELLKSKLALDKLNNNL